MQRGCSLDQDALKWLEALCTLTSLSAWRFSSLCMTWTCNTDSGSLIFDFLFFSPSSDKQISLHKDWRKHREEEHTRERKSNCYLFPQEWSGGTGEGAQTLPSRISLLKHVCVVFCVTFWFCVCFWAVKQNPNSGSFKTLFLFCRKTMSTSSTSSPENPKDATLSLKSLWTATATTNNWRRSSSYCEDMWTWWKWTLQITPVYSRKASRNLHISKCCVWNRVFTVFCIAFRFVWRTLVSKENFRPRQMC